MDLNRRKIHILDLPTEALSAIFSFVKFDNGFVELNSLQYFDKLAKIRPTSKTCG